MTGRISDLAAMAPVMAPPENPEFRCFTVYVDRRSFGLPVEAIQTVFEITAVTPVPLSPPSVLGLVNLRGKIATAVSLKRRLGGGTRDMVEQSMLAVGIDHAGETFALVVDEVGDVLSLDASTKIEMPPHLGSEGLKFSSVHRLDAQILPILDLDWTLALDEDGRLDGPSVRRITGPDQ